jgi:hypothetical protein
VQPALRSGERLDVRRFGGPCRPRHLGIFTGFGLVDPRTVHDRDVGTLHRAVAERQFGSVKDGVHSRAPLPTADIGRVFRHYRSRLLYWSRGKQTSAESRQSFVDTYSGRKRTIYQAAADSLQVSPLRRSDAVVKAFVKVEKGTGSVPRLISPRSPRYNVEVGRRLKFVEKRLYKAIDQIYGETTCCKGLNLYQRGALLRRKWDMYIDPAAVVLDASRFDQHVSQPWLRWEHSVYNAIFRDPELAELLKWQLVNKGTGRAPDGRVDYTIQGTRCSGDMNTSLGNVLIMTAMVWVYLREVGITASLANDGDDCVVIMTRLDTQRFIGGLKDRFLSFGFTMRVESTVRVFERIDFCQMRPVCVNGKWVMVRRLRKALSSDVASTSMVNRKTTRSQLQVVGVCGGVQCCGVPVYQAFYAHLASGQRTVKMSVENAGYGFFRHAMMIDPELRVQQRDISPETRVSFFNAFGIKPDLQTALESMYSGSWDVEEVTPVETFDRVSSVYLGYSGFPKFCAHLQDDDHYWREE